MAADAEFSTDNNLLPLKRFIFLFRGRQRLRVKLFRREGYKIYKFDLYFNASHNSYYYHIIVKVI